MMLFTSPEMNETSAAPARSGLTAATGPEPTSRLARSYSASSLAFPSVGGSDGYPSVEGQRRLGLRQRRFRHHRLHRVARVLELLLRQRPQIAERERPLGNHVGLAGRGAAAQHLVEVHRRPAENQAGIEREVLLARQLAAEAVDDARQLVVGAVARSRAGRSATSAPVFALTSQLPRRGAAARRHGELRIAGPVLEPERVLRPLRRARRAPRARRPAAPPNPLRRPVMTTMTFMSSRAPASLSALSAATMMTSPPFMSMMPGPLAVESSIAS